MLKPKSKSRTVLAAYLGAKKKQSGLYRYGAAVCINYIKGNSAPYFSVTGFAPDRCGCLHEELLQCWPELKPIIDLHLSEDTGMPVYAVENGFYWLKEGAVTHLAEHLRIDTDWTKELITKYALRPFSKEFFTSQVVEPQRLRYFKEAMAAVDLIRYWQKKHPDRISHEAYRRSLSWAVDRV